MFDSRSMVSEARPPKRADRALSTSDCGADFASAQKSLFRGPRLVLCSILVAGQGALAASGSGNLALVWEQLPSLPDPVGFASPFAGVCGGALIVAGGANFPGAMPWDGGKKVWYDSVFVLPKPGGKWLTGFKLPRPAAYGVSLTTRRGVLCAGGSDGRKHTRDVFLLRWRGGGITIKPLPQLPEPMANGCGALLDQTVYLAGGIEETDATNSMSSFWMLNLAAPRPRWQALDPWPGPSRTLAVAGVLGDAFYLFGGVELTGDSEGKPVRRYLQDAYRFEPHRGWKKVADMPRPAAAAPSPAPVRKGRLLIISGDDGKFVDFEPKTQHPGFPKNVLAYDPNADQWTRFGDCPISRATVPVVEWKKQAVIPNGEVRPGRRTPQVWQFDLR